MTVAQIAASATISVRVFDDANNDGSYFPGNGDAGIGGVTVQLIDERTSIVVAAARTETDGTYLFEDIAEGSYRLVRDATVGYLDGDETAGTLGGNVNNSADSPDGFLVGVEITPGASASYRGGDQANFLRTFEQAPPSNQTVNERTSDAFVAQV